MKVPRAVLAGLLVVTALVALLGPAGSAAAQTANLSVSGLPSDALVVTSGSSHRASANVTFGADQFICTGSGTFPVNLSVTALSGVESAVVSPAVLNFSVSPGVYGGPTAYSAVRPLTVTVAASGTIPANATRTLTLAASFAGGSVPNCTAGGSFPAAQTSGSFQASFVAPASSGSGGTGGGSGTGGSSGGSGSTGGSGGNGVPAPGAALVVAALAAAVVLERTRSR